MATTRSVVEIELAMRGAAAARAALDGLGASATTTGTRVTQATMGLQRMSTVSAQVAQGARLSALQVQQLGFQLNDVATGLASGQSPFTILAQQSGQVFHALGMGPGGVGGALKAIGNMLPGLATRFALVSAAAIPLAGAVLGIRDRLAQSEEENATASLGERNKKFAAGLERVINDQEARGLITSDRARSLRAAVTGAVADRPAADELDVSTDAERDQSGMNRAMNIVPKEPRATAYTPQRQADILSGVAKDLLGRLMTDAQEKATYKANEAKAKADDDYRRAKLARDEAANEMAFQREEISLDQFMQRKREIAIEGNSITLDALTRQEEQLNQDLLDLSVDMDKEKAAAAKITIEGELAANKTMRLAAEEELMTELARIDQGYEEAMLKADEEAIKEHSRKMEEAQRAQEKADREHQAALQEELRLRQQIFDLEMQLIDSDPSKTNPEKWNEKLMAINNAMEAGTIGRGEGELMIRALGADPLSFMDQLKEKMAQVRDAWGTMQQQMSTGVVNLVTDSVSGLSGALTSVIMGTKSAGAAFAQFGISLLTNFISMILQAILWATVAIPILTALGILSGGATAAQGAAVTGMALGAGASMAGAIVGGRALGGSVIAGLPYIVGEQRPEIFVPETSGRIIPQVDGAAMGGGGGPGGKGGVNIYFAESMRDGMNKAVQNGHHDAVLVDWFQRNKVRLGMKG